MSYQPHNLLAFGGTLQVASADDEIWECTIRAGVAGGLGGPIVGADCDEFLTAWKTLMSAWFAAVNSKMGSTVKMTYLKCNPIDAAGHYSDPTPHTYVYPSPVAGASTPASASFTSVVYSWRADASVGLGTKGRMYPPNTGIGQTGGGAVIGTSAQTTAATQATTFITNIRGITLGDGGVLTPCIFSKSGPANKITSVLVGNVLDLQRRRKNRIRETYVASVFH